MERCCINFYALCTFLFSFSLSRVACGDNEPFQCRTLEEHSGTSGDIYSPFYKSGTYPLGLWCEYRITAPVGYQIKITFEDLDISPYTFCSEAAVSIFEKEFDGRRLAKVCGSERPLPVITSPGVNVVHILFTSEFIGSGRGFHLHYEAAPFYSECEEGLTLCPNGHCYNAATQTCDGKDDCGDGTDEEGCNLPLAESECGNPPIAPDTDALDQDRIIGGKEVIPNSWPWQVSMQNRNAAGNSHICGGTLLNAQWVLTAAHCFVGMTNTSQWRIHLGKHHKYFTDKTEQIRYVERIIIWPNTTGEIDQMKGKFDINNDIGLIKLNAPIKFTDYVRPACLPDFKYDLPESAKCYATGWGQTRGTGSNHVLKQTHVHILTRYVCGYHEDTQICVRNKDQLSSTCHGDSGGPLNCKLGGKWHVMGATSFGTLTNTQVGICAVEGQETIFMKVSDKVKWIHSMINRYG